MRWWELLYLYSRVVYTLRFGVVDPNDDKDVLELRTHILRREGESTGFLEHDRDDVVPDVSLPE